MPTITDYMRIYNPWLENGIVPDTLLDKSWRKRPLYAALKESLKADSIIALRGIRRAGKTTLMYQLIDGLLKQTDKFHAIYFSFDSPDVLKLDDPIGVVFEEYSKLLKLAGMANSLHDLKQPVYVFFDEIQKVREFRSYLKIWHDTYKKTVKISISGSASMLLKSTGTKSTESLFGRVSDYVLHPMRFPEFVTFSGSTSQNVLDAIEKVPKVDLRQMSIGGIQRLRETLQENAKLLSPYMKDFDEAYLTYITMGGMPAIVTAKDRNLAVRYFNEMRESLLSRIPVDMSEALKEEVNADTVGNILIHIAENPGLRLIDKKAANDLQIDRMRFRKYVDALEKTLLVFEIYKLSSIRNKLKYRTKLKKAYVEDNSIIIALDWLFTDAIDTAQQMKLAPPLSSARTSNTSFLFNKFYNTAINEYAGALTENAVANFINDIFTTTAIRFYSNHNEVDFIVMPNLVNKENVLLLEVASKSNIEEKAKTLNKVEKKFPKSCKIILTTDSAITDINRKDNVLVIPAWLFMLTLTQ